MRHEGLQDRWLGIRVLLTGAAGFLSSHLIPAFLGRGDEIVGYEILPKGAAPRVQKHIDKPGFTYIWKSVVDMTEKDLKGIDVVVHTAGVTDVPLSNSSPRYTYQLNLDAATSLCVAARETKTPILAMSTENVYGALPEELLPAKEDAPYRPRNAYAASKVAMEALLHAYSYQWKIPVGVIRSSTLFGPRMRTGQVVSIFTRAAMEGKPITIEGDGSQTRDFNYVDNMVQAILKVTHWLTGYLPKGDYELAGSKATGGFNAWNIGTGQELTLKEFVEMILEVTHSDSEVKYGPWRPGEEGRLCISIEKARNELGYDPSVTVKEGLDRLSRSMMTALGNYKPENLA